VSSRIRATHAEIRLSNLTHNFRFLKSLLKGSSFICPMVKASAYGHGATECAVALAHAGVHDLGVVLVEEGIRLREAGVKGAILVFGTFHNEAAAQTVKYSLTPVISRWQDLKEFEKNIDNGENYGIHLKFNTGMNRLGFAVDDAAKLAEALKKSKKLSLSGVCTHLLQGEDSEDTEGRSKQQVTDLKSLETHFSGKNIPFHALNSSALCSEVFSGIGARPGIALYGAQPALNKKRKLDLRPVMSVKSQIELLQKVKKGQTVSYGGTWTAKRDSVIGILPMGYADGYPRSASNKSQMLVRGERVPVTGIVCMDYTMIDLTDLNAKKEIRIGEEAVVFGTQGAANYSVDELALAAGTISYEILTRVSARVPRIYLHEVK
jgi:alanine racemase